MKDFGELFKSAMLAEEFLERRDRVKAHYGPRYEEKIAPAKELLRSVSRRTGATYMEVARQLCNRSLRHGQGQAVNPILAAMVELIEAGKLSESPP